MGKYLGLFSYHKKLIYRNETTLKYQKQTNKKGTMFVGYILGDDDFWKTKQANRTLKCRKQ